MLSDLIEKEKGCQNVQNTSDNESNNEESSSDIENHEGEEEVRGTQRQFLENIGSEDDLRSRIFGTFVVKFLDCLSIFNGFLQWKAHLEFWVAFFLAEIFEKVSFDPCHCRITRLSARKSEQMKNF